MSAFVMVIKAASASQLEPEPLPEPLEHARVDTAHLLVGQRTVRGPIGDRIRQALLARGDRRTVVAVEQTDRLDARIGQRADLLEDRSGRKRFVHDNRKVARDSRESGQGPQLDAARTIVGEDFEVKLGYP